MNFHLNEKKVLEVPLNVGMALLYNAYFLVHHQVRSPGCKNLVNISAHTNKTWYDKARHTVIRNKARNKTLNNEYLLPIRKMAARKRK